MLHHQPAAGVLHDAEAVAEHPAGFIRADEDRGFIIPEDFLQFGSGILGRRAFEEIGSAVVVYHVDLKKKVQDGGDILRLGFAKN